MFPPGKRYSWNERIRNQGDNAISRTRLRELSRFQGLTIERIQINARGDPEYICVRYSNGKYSIRSITTHRATSFYGIADLMRTIEILGEYYGLVSVI
jgi:hypothetical protein